MIAPALTIETAKDILRSRAPLFQGTHLPLTVWFLAIDLISEAKTRLPALALKRLRGVAEKAC